MKREITKAVAMISIVAISAQVNVNAKTDYSMPEVVRCTCYVTSGTTKSGTQTHKGTISGKAEWLGSVAVLYSIDEDGSIGEYIGTFQFEDTGSNEGLKAGTSVDVWQPSMEEAKEWISEYGDYVYMQVIEGKG